MHTTVIEVKGAGAGIAILALAVFLLSTTPARADWPKAADYQIDWGLSTDQVEASDMPVDDSGWSTITPASADIQAVLDWLDTHHGSGSAADSATFITVAAEAGLTAERVLAASGYVTLTDGGANGSLTIGLDPIAYSDLTGEPWTLATNAIMFANTNYHLELVKSGGNVLTAYATGDTYGRFSISTDGEMSWGSGSAGGDVFLQRIAASVLGVDTTDAFRCGLFSEVKEAAVSTPAGITSGYAQYRVDASGRPYLVNDGDNVYDLGADPPVVVDCRLLADHYDSAAYNAGIGTEATVAATTVTTWDWTNEGCTASYLNLTWYASCVGVAPDWVYTQSQVAVPSPTFAKQDGDGNCRVFFQARLKVNDTSAFDAVYLVLSDVNSSNTVINSTKTDVLSSLSSGTWAWVELSSSGVDVGTWQDTLRVSVLAQGKLYAATTEDQKTEICLEQYEINQYPD